VRVLPQERRRVRQTHRVGQCDGGGPRGTTVQAAVQPEGLRDLRADPSERVERRARFLEHHAQVRAAVLRPLAVGQADELPPAQADAAGHVRTGGLQPHQGERGHRLPGSGRADHADATAGRHGERHTVQDRPPRDAHRETRDLESGARVRPAVGSGRALLVRVGPVRVCVGQAVVCVRHAVTPGVVGEVVVGSDARSPVVSRGSVASRTASPSSESAATTRAIAAPGHAALHGWTPT